MSQQSFESDSPYTYQINKLFSKKQDKEADLIWSVITLLIYKDSTNPEIPYLYEKFGMKDFLTLCHILGGKTIKFPHRKEIESHLLTALLYYEREINNLDWPEIHRKYPEIEISSLKYSLKINNLDSFVKTRIQDIFRELKKQQGENNVK